VLLLQVQILTLCEKISVPVSPDQSVNNPTSWQWIFEGGDSFYLPAIKIQLTICYDVPRYLMIVTLNPLLNAYGSDTLTLSNFITIYSYSHRFPTISQVGYTLTRLKPGKFLSMAKFNSL
jgi:hypothetical protein